MDITKVKLNSKGNKGLKAWYSKGEVVDDIDFIITSNGVNYSRPVGRDLRVEFNRLKSHLLMACGFWRKEYTEHYDTETGKLADTQSGKGKTNKYYSELHVHLDSVEITQVAYTEKGILISGKKRFDDTTKYFALNTVLISESDGYEYFDNLVEICDGIYQMVDEYVNAKSIGDKGTMLIDFGYGEEDVSGMNEEEKTEKFIEYIESKGNVVFSSEEMGVTDDEDGNDSNDTKVIVEDFTKKKKVEAA